MLNNLKRMLENASDMIDDEFDLALAQGDSDEIKDRFLDDPEAIIIGSENDPQIAKLINIIPESEDLDSVKTMEINKIIESSIPGTVIKGTAASYLENDLSLTDKDDEEDIEDKQDEIDDMTE